MRLRRKETKEPRFSLERLIKVNSPPISLIKQFNSPSHLASSLPLTSHHHHTSSEPITHSLSTSINPIHMPKPRPIILLIVAMCVTSGLLYGYNLGVVAGAILFVVDDFHLSGFFKDAVVSASLLGAMFGAITGGKLADRFGRRRIVMLGAIIGALGAACAACSPNPAALLTSRIIVGISIGTLTCVTPLFIAEISPSQLRGRLGSLFSVALTCGLLSAYLSDFSLRGVDHDWRWMFALGIVPASLLVIVLIALPESPRWLVAHNRINQARSILQRIAGSPDVDADLNQIQAALTNQKSRWTDLVSPLYRKALLAGVGVAVTRHATGVAIATFWAPQIFKIAGFGSRSVELLGTVGVGLAFVVFGLVGLWLVDRLGRRPLMLGGLLGMVLALATLALLFRSPEMSGASGKLAVVAFMIFVAAFTAGPGVVVFLLVSEILPLQIRALGMGIANVALWGIYLLSTMTFPMLLSVAGDSGAFLSYAAIGTLAWLFIFFVIPETKGRTLEDIEAEWRK
ncbi:MAG: sugar porter family MFS transporter [Verrucomicrobiota bacterium]